MGAHIGNRARRRRNRRAKLKAWQRALRTLYAHVANYRNVPLHRLPNPRSVWGPTYRCPDSRYHTRIEAQHKYDPTWTAEDGQRLHRTLERLSRVEDA